MGKAVNGIYIWDIPRPALHLHNNVSTVISNNDILVLDNTIHLNISTTAHGVRMPPTITQCMSTDDQIVQINIIIIDG